MGASGASFPSQTWVMLTPPDSEQLEDALVAAQQAAYSVAGVDESVRPPSLLFCAS